MPRYSVEIFSGRVYVGNGTFDSSDGFMKFITDDGFCDKAVVYDNEEKVNFTIKITRE